MSQMFDKHRHRILFHLQTAQTVAKPKVEPNQPTCLDVCSVKEPGTSLGEFKRKKEENPQRGDMQLISWGAVAMRRGSNISLMDHRERLFVLKYTVQTPCCKHLAVHGFFFFFFFVQDSEVTPSTWYELQRQFHSRRLRHFRESWMHCSNYRLVFYFFSCNKSLWHTVVLQPPPKIPWQTTNH